MVRSAGGWLRQSSSGNAFTATLVGVQVGSVITCCSDGVEVVQLHLSGVGKLSGSGRTSSGVGVVVVVVVSVGDLGDLLVADLLSNFEKPVMPLFCVVA